MHSPSLWSAALRIDLHAHSTASDGTTSPAAVVRRAAALGVDVVALTDHDTTAGWAEAQAAAPDGVTVLPGVEISCCAPAEAGGSISLHLLAYAFDPEDADLTARFEAVRTSRVQRARGMVERLRADGHEVTWTQVERLADGGTVGRPHVARALVEVGAIATVDEAFTADWIATRGRYYVGKEEIPVLEAIAMVRAAGGVTVFAHPRATKRGRVVSDATIEAMAAAGLTGLEVDHPDHEGSERAELRALAAELGLLVTGSSDYHGAGKAQDLGACLTAPDAYEALLAAVPR